MEIKDVIPIACDGLPHQNILFENDLSVIIKLRDTMENTLLNARATLPSYDRSKLVPRIVHLGFGAFHRAHQAVYADILAAEHGSDWGYTEVNLIGGEQQIADLQQQDNCSIPWRKCPPMPGPRASSAWSKQALHAQVDGLESVLAKMCEPQVAIVSLTITEKGYCHSPATGQLHAR